jgi:hypothetical protein
VTYSILLSSKQLQNFLEIVALACVLLAFAAPRFGRRFFSQIAAHFKRLALRRRSAILLAAAFPMAARLALIPILGFPAPAIHDDFSYLLLGDTFAHGRLANPTPPEWRHFESEYVLLTPTYASQYQPAQGLFLAAGQVLAGHPWWGVWLQMGVMFGAICWALSQALPVRWALAGAFLAGMQFGIYGFWMNSYFGGAAAATGGALVFGSLLRIGRHSARSGALCAFGLVVLFASRPFEASLWTVAALWFMARHRHRIRAFAPGFAVVFVAGLSALAGYNARVTGNPFKPPYELYRERYGVPQSFWWQPAVTIRRFDFPQLRENYENQLSYWRRRTSPALLWDSTWRRLRDFWRFFLGPFLTPALFFAGYLWRDPRVRPWFFISALLILDHATYHAWYPQQSAPATVLIVLLLLQCWRRMRVWRRRQGFGLALSRNLVAGFALSIVAVSAGRAMESRLPAASRRIWTSLFPAPRQRERALAYLESIPGRHLVFVDYSAHHAFGEEWVFNGADIERERVTFARSCSTPSDLALIRALPDHDVWLARPDENSLVRINPRNMLPLSGGVRKSLGVAAISARKN